MPKVFPHLWFKDQAEDAMAFYTSIFKDSKVLSRNVMPDPELSVVRFELAGQPVVALNASSPAHYNESFSFLIETEGQAETDYFWNALIADGGKEQPCGWLTDKFGVFWQVTTHTPASAGLRPRPGQGRARAAGHVQDE